MRDGSFDVLAVNRNNAAHLFVGCTLSGYMAVLVSTNGGTDFTSHQIPAAPYGYVRAVGVNPQDDQTIYVGGYYYPDGTFQTALFKTTDGGAIWQDVRGTIEDASVDAIEVDPVDPNVVLAMAGTSLYKSVDAGSTWVDITPSLGLLAIRINPEVPNEIYASTGDDFLLSQDGGGSWTSIAEGLEFPGVTGIDLIPAVKMIIAGTNGGGIFRNRREALYTVSIAAISGGTTDPAPGVYGHEEGAALDIAGIPHTGYKFKNWAGDVSGTANPFQITVDSDIGVKALFHLAAPAGFSVVKREARSLLQVQYINVLTWQRITGIPDVAAYRIYSMNGAAPTLLAEVDASTFTYWHRGVAKAGVYQYALAAVDANGLEGEAVLASNGSVVTTRRSAEKTRRK